jgi:hypothetical protein
LTLDPADSRSAGSFAVPTPIPLIVKVTGPFAVLTVMLPLAAPSAVGAKYTLNWQEVPAARLSPQVLPGIEANSLSPAELAKTAVEAVVLVTVTCFVTLSVPTSTSPKLTEAGLYTTAPPTPVPLMVKVTGPSAVLSVRIPVAGPATVGAK